MAWFFLVLVGADFSIYTRINFSEILAVNIDKVLFVIHKFCIFWR